MIYYSEEKSYTIYVYYACLLIPTRSLEDILLLLFTQELFDIVDFEHIVCLSIVTSKSLVDFLLSL